MSPQEHPDVDEALREIFTTLYQIQRAISRLMERIDELYLEDIPPF